ncbi:MAG: M56 family metallopeptidase, partial [Bacteroidota bacterium]
MGLLGLATGFAVAFYQNFNYTPVCENLTATSISLAELGLNLTGSAPEQTGKELTFQFLSGLAPWVSLVYLFGLLPAAVYLLRDQRRVHFLSTTGLTELPGSWTNKIVQELSDHPATKRVKTYFSAHANEVMTLGFWSPVIVFPVALINALSPEMARTILLHEIAHLRHYDHWLNYPQQFIRTLFFYHPVAHGLCRIIDQEREHRCDDWVAARCQDRRTYATALVTVARSSINPSNTLVMSATKTPFSQRIQRLFQGEEQRSGHAAFSLLLASLLAVGHLSFTSLGADAGAVDCLEEQGKVDALLEPDFNPVIIDVDGEEINIPLVEELPAEVPVKVLAEPIPAPEATILFTADESTFTATLEFPETKPAVQQLPRTEINSIFFADTIPPAAGFKAKKEKTTISIRPSGKDPLYVVDGKIMDRSTMELDLDPDDIKTINVYKGQTATTEYGPEGKNGVVVIITKGKSQGEEAAPAPEKLEKAIEKKTNVVVSGYAKKTRLEQPLMVIDGQEVERDHPAHLL